MLGGDAPMILRGMRALQLKLSFPPLRVFLIVYLYAINMIKIGDRRSEKSHNTSILQSSNIHHFVVLRKITIFAVFHRYGGNC